jgi:hypothetical protein
MVLEVADFGISSVQSLGLAIVICVRYIGKLNYSLKVDSNNPVA